MIYKITNFHGMVSPHPDAIKNNNGTYTIEIKDLHFWLADQNKMAMVMPATKKSPWHIIITNTNFTKIEHKFTKKQEELMGNVPDIIVAKKAKSTLSAVRNRRRELGIPYYVHTREFKDIINFVGIKILRSKILGKYPDEIVAKKFGVGVHVIVKMRNEKNIASYQEYNENKLLQHIDNFDKFLEGFKKK